MESLPFQKGSTPSRVAAVTMARYAKTARYRVFAFVAKNAPVTDADIQAGLQMGKNTERPRRIELEHAGLIRPCGEDPFATGRVRFEPTGVSYPENPPKDFWRSRMRSIRADRPTGVEIGIAVQTMRAAYKAMGGKFPPEAVRVLKWLALQSTEET